MVSCILGEQGWSEDQCLLSLAAYTFASCAISAMGRHSVMRGGGTLSCLYQLQSSLLNRFRTVPCTWKFNETGRVGCTCWQRRVDDGLYKKIWSDSKPSKPGVSITKTQKDALSILLRWGLSWSEQNLHWPIYSVVVTSPSQDRLCSMSFLLCHEAWRAERCL